MSLNVLQYVHAYHANINIMAFFIENKKTYRHRLCSPYCLVLNPNHLSSTLPIASPPVAHGKIPLQASCNSLPGFTPRHYSNTLQLPNLENSGKEDPIDAREATQGLITPLSSLYGTCMRGL